MNDFLFEGGYAAYVWSAYAISAAGIGAMVVLTLAAYRRARRTLAGLQHSETNL
jgi:heme exporter protein CcmD